MTSVPPAPVAALQLEQIKTRRDRAQTTLRLEARALDDFLVSDEKRVVLRLDSAYRPDVGDATDDASPTAFAIAMLLGGEAPHPNVALGRQLVPDLEPMCLSAAADYQTIHETGPQEQGKNAGPLPNCYNTPLYLWSLATIFRAGLFPEADRSALLIVGNGFADYLAKCLVEGVGRISELNPTQASDDMHTQLLESLHDYGRPYLTFLCTRALIAWMAVEREGAPDEDQWTRALELVRARADIELSREVAAYESGVQSLFDAVDITCCQAILALSSAQLGREDEYTRPLVQRARRLILEHFILDDGSFAPKGPAFDIADKSSVILSSAEVGCILLAGMTHGIAADELLGLDALLAKVRRTGGARGWGHEAAGSQHRRTAFATVAALFYLHHYSALAAKLASAFAIEALEVKPVGLSSVPLTYNYPDEIRAKLETRVITPIKSGRRDLASMSFVLSGPPGTSKSTIAKKIALDLGWPLLTLELGSFLHEGIAALESEAERIFDLLLELENVVVLFDELEEVLYSRESDDSEREGRFLTSAMLPRFHRLRDKGNVLFMIATNFRERLDAAATRPGRFDMELKVDPPNEADRRAMLESLCERYNVFDAVRATLLSEKTVVKTEKFTYTYLQELTKSLQLDPEIVDDDKKVEGMIKDLKDRLDAEQKSHDASRAGKSAGGSR